MKNYRAKMSFAFLVTAIILLVVVILIIDTEVTSKSERYEMEIAELKEDMIKLEAKIEIYEKVLQLKVFMEQLGLRPNVDTLVEGEEVGS